MLNAERQVWPSRWPRTTFLALLIPLALLYGFWENLRPSFTPLQSYYMGRYVRSAATGWLGIKNGNSLIYVLTNKDRARPALNSDVIEMQRSIRAVDPKTVAFFLSRKAIQAGGVKLRELPVKSVTPNQLTSGTEFHRFLQHFVYRRSLLYFYRGPLLALVLSWVLLVPFAIRHDLRRRQKARFGVQLRGPVMVDRYQFNRKVRGDGLRFFVSAKRGLLEVLKGKGSRFIRLRKRHEAQSIAIIGDTVSAPV